MQEIANFNKKTENIRNFLRDLADRESRAWHLKQGLNPYTAYYLYYRVGDAVISDVRPDGYELATAQRISPAWNIEKVHIFVYETLQKCAVLLP